MKSDSVQTIDRQADLIDFVQLARSAESVFETRFLNVNVVQFCAGRLRGVDDRPYQRAAAVGINIGRRGIGRVHLGNAGQFAKLAEQFLSLIHISIRPESSTVP